jgi:hypothetical protein
MGSMVPRRSRLKSDTSGANEFLSSLPLNPCPISTIPERQCTSVARALVLTAARLNLGAGPITSVTKSTSTLRDLDKRPLESWKTDDDHGSSGWRRRWNGLGGQYYEVSGGYIAFPFVLASMSPRLLSSLCCRLLSPDSWSYRGSSNQYIGRKHQHSVQSNNRNRLFS